MDGWRHPAVTQGDGPPAIFYRRAPESTSKISIKAPRVAWRRLETFHFPCTLFRDRAHIRNQGGSGVERMLSQTGDQGLAALLDRCRHKVLARRPRPLARAIFSCLLRRDASRQERRTYARSPKGGCTLAVGSRVHTYRRGGHRGPWRKAPPCRRRVVGSRARVSDVNRQIEFPSYVIMCEGGKVTP